MSIRNVPSAIAQKHDRAADKISLHKIDVAVVVDVGGLEGIRAERLMVGEAEKARRVGRCRRPGRAERPSGR